MQRTVLTILTLLAFGLVLPSCSSTDPDGSGTVKMNSTLTNSEVNRADDNTKGADRVEGMPSTVKIERVRILISRLKFKSVSEDTSGGRDIKTGPAIVTFENDEVNVVFQEPVPNGTYDRVKLEKHKFSSSEAEQYKDDPTFGEFADPERLTIIIEGTYNDGTEQPFVIQDDATENLWIDFEEDLVIDDDTDATIELSFDAQQVFKQNNTVLNPFDDKDRRDIFKNLKKAFRLQND